MLKYILNSAGDGYVAISESDRSIERAVIPDTYNSLPVTEVNASFEEFPNLKEVIIGNNVTKTGYGTFNCETLERIYLGKSINSICGPFAACKNLSAVYFSGDKESFEILNIVVVDESNEIFTSVPVYYGVLGKGGVLTIGEDKFFPVTHWDCVKSKPENISSKKVTYDNDVSGLNAKTVKDAIDELNAKNFDASSLESWEQLKYLVRSGRAADLIKIGDRFACRKGEEELVWIVIGIDEDIPQNEDFTHSVTLQLDRCYNNFPFSVPEASVHVMDEMPAGQYYIGLKNYASDTVYYSLTFDENIPSGTRIRMSGGIAYLYASRTTSPYATINASFSSEDKSQMTGICLGEKNYAINSYMGTVNYADSNVRQWLNSEGVNWWSSTNGLTLSPAEYVNVPGFLSGLDEDFLDAVNPVKKTTVLPDGREVETADKFFLVSGEEVYASGEKHYSYYKENSALTGPEAVADAIRVRNLSGAARHWWLRNPANGDDGYMRVLTDSGVGSVKAAKVLAYGVVPTCCIC